jgi:hypothetical protein
MTRDFNLPIRSSNTKALPENIFALLSLLVCIGAGVYDANGQSATLQGIIHDQSTGQPLEGANIVLKHIDDETRLGMATDPNGFYAIENIDPGTYELTISFVGYESYHDTLSLNSGDRIRVNVGLEPDEAMLEEFVISQTSGITKLEAGRQQISSSDLGQMPTPAGSGDLASYIQTLPGVVATGDRGGQLYIRGGTPSQNMVLIDGTLIYQPFHILGFFSAFPEDLISETDFYAGGFGPRYTGRISSVIDVKMRSGDRYETRGSGSVSPFITEIMAEGPIKEGKSSWIASVRGSLVEETSPFLLGKRQPLYFDSQYLKTSFFGDGNSRCSVMGMRTYDRGRLDVEEDDIFSWSNFVLGGRCVVLPESSDLLFDVNLGFSHISNSAGSSTEPERTSESSLINLDINLTRFLGQIRLNYGWFLHVNPLNYDMSELFGGPQTGSENVLSSGVYVRADLPVGDRLTLSPGMAASAYRGITGINFEPRLRGTWQPWNTEEKELNFAAGIYQQSIAGITDKRDAGSVFTAWMPVPVGGPRMEAIHALLGWHQQIDNLFNFSIEGYYKDLSNIPVSEWSTIARFTTDLASADGTVYGGDLRLEANTGPIYGSLGYGYSWTQYTTTQSHFDEWFGDPTQQYHPIHDRRHQVSAQFNAELGDYSVGMHWQFGTGLPFTRPLGFDEMLQFRQKLPYVKEEFGATRALIDKPYQGRMPDYHRLDISVKRSIELKFAQMELQAGAINLYDKINLFYYDVYKHQRFDQLPIAPYFSVKMETK